LMPPDWAFEFHGHRCPFLPLGFRMGQLALERLAIAREKNHGLHVIAESGEGHPQACLIDGIQVATGATFGKTLIEKTYWGKLSATFWYPGKTPVRYSLKPAFLDELGKMEFFSYRKRGVEPARAAGRGDFRRGGAAGFFLHAAEGFLQQIPLFGLRRVCLRTLRAFPRRPAGLHPVFRLSRVRRASARR